MTIEELKFLLLKSWTKETCSPGYREEWSSENPSLGQCAITAMAVHELFNAKIMRCMTPTGSHYYNMINDQIVDLTVEQFGGCIPDYEHGEERTYQYLYENADTRSRYEQLMDNLKEVFLNSKQYTLINGEGKEYLSFFPGTLGGHRKQKIYGRLDCKSANNWLKKGFYAKNRVFFLTEEDAINAGYRPCAVCMPEAYEKWKSEQESKPVGRVLRPGNQINR